MKISSKCNVKKEIILLCFMKKEVVKLIFLLYKCLRNIWMVPCCLAGDLLELRFLSVALLLADASEPSWLEFEESGNRKTHSIVLIVMTIGSAFNRVQGTLIWSSWMWPDTKVKGRPSSFSRTSSLKSKLEKTTSPPQRLTCNFQDFF